MSESEFPMVVCGTTVGVEPFGTGAWVVRLSDADDYVCVDGLDDVEDAETVARSAAALLRRTVERATAELQADRDRLAAILAGDFPRLKSIAFPDPSGALAMQFTPTWMLGLFAHSFGEMLGAAPNYVESVELESQHPEQGRLVFTIQRAAGKSPHEMREEAEVRCADLQSRLDTAVGLAQDILAGVTAEKNRSNALQDRLDAAMAFADPVARKALLATLAPETIESYLLAHGWTNVSSPSLVNTRQWRRGGTETHAAIPLRVGFCDYAFCVNSALDVIAASEGRPAVAVYLDMVAK